MNLNLSLNIEKKSVFEQIEAELKKENFTIISQDQTRPWGGFFVLDESQLRFLLQNSFRILK